MLAEIANNEFITHMFIMEYNMEGSGEKDVVRKVCNSQTEIVRRMI